MSSEYATVIAADSHSIVSSGSKMGHKCCGCCCDMRRAVIICDVFLLVVGVISLSFASLERNGVNVLAETLNQVATLNDDAFRTLQGDASVPSALSIDTQEPVTSPTWGPTAGPFPGPTPVPKNGTNGGLGAFEDDTFQGFGDDYIDQAFEDAFSAFEDDAFGTSGDDAFGTFEDDTFQAFLQGDDAFGAVLSEEQLKQAEDLLLGMIILTIVQLATTIASIWGAIKYKCWPVAANVVALGMHAILPFFMASPNVMAAAVTTLWIYPHVVFCVEVRSGVLCQETYGREEFSCCCVTKRILVSADGVPVSETELV